MVPKSLSVSLSFATGAIGRPGSLDLVVRMSGIVGVMAGGTFAHREQGFREVDLSDGALRELCRLAGDLEFIEREPRVRSTVDTSDSWAEVLLHVAHEGGRRTLVLHLQAGGFEGEDAAPLRRFFRVLLDAAGVRDPSIRYRLSEES